MLILDAYSQSLLHAHCSLPSFLLNCMFQSDMTIIRFEYKSLLSTAVL
jgi:hypothetical protein